PQGTILYTPCETPAPDSVPRTQGQEEECGVPSKPHVSVLGQRVLSLISGRAVKKPRKVRPQGRRMMRGYTTETGGGGDDGGHIPPPPQVSHNASVLPAVQVLDTPTKSPFDKKEYRVIRLDCGIRVLLISDAGRFIAGAEEEDDSEEEEIDQNEEDEVDQSEDDDDDDAEIEDEEEEEGDIKGGKSGADSTKYLAAASLTVGVGSFEDPPEIPGLMHFLEHMVFMGSEKYPKENAFDYYIKKHGGHDNAHTDMEHTTFYFEVQECYLHESLDRFAQFFINPLMKQEAMTREREAVHSGHEGRGSILSCLKKKVWAVGLYSGNDESGFEHNSTYAVMSISVELTDEGFKNIDKVLCIVFQYMAMIQRAGPVERIFREIQQMEQLNFDYAEEPTTIENVENLSEAMQIFPPVDYLTGDTLMGDYNPQIIKECLDALVPEKCNILISSKTFDEQNICHLTEKWFGTKYSVEDIPKSWEEQWANLPTNPELHIPATNHFIPDNFDLLSSEKDVPEYPEKLCQDDWGELWFRQDLKFKLPRSYCYIFLLSELPLQSPRLAALLDLYLNLFQQQVMEDVYPANMAQYQYSISASERGIVIKMNGFNQKLSKLLDLLLHHMETFGDNLHEKAFQEIRQQQMKSYHNAILKPGIVRKDVRLSIIQQVHWTAHQKLAEVKNVTSKDLLEEFVARLFPSCHVQMLVQGNTTASQALDMYSMVKATKEKHLVIEKCPLPELRTLELQSGCWVARVNGVNSADTNSSVVNYYQYKEGSLMLEVILEFIQMVMDEPVFDVLRTREQLGYHVFCTNHNTFGILGLSITVNTQANKFSVSHVDERIEAFLEEFMTTVKNMKDDELSELQETLTSMKQTIDLTLREEVDRNWSEIVHAEYVFDRLKRQIELIKNITHESVINCVRKITSSDDNTGYKKLSVQVAGAAKPEGRSPPSLESLMGNTGIVQLLEPNGESDRKLPVERFITDIGNHKKQLRLYPVTKII
ncbi:Nardilysin-like, partial [Homarus americanus]